MIALLLAALTVTVPDRHLTPGVVRPLSKTTICTTRWGLDRRHVTTAMKRAAAKAYGLPFPVPYRVEWDHLIPRELGGADDVGNLWPEPWDQARHIKDPEENRLHKAVCAGTMTLGAAQERMRRWSPP